MFKGQVITIKYRNDWSGSVAEVVTRVVSFRKLLPKGIGEPGKADRKTDLLQLYTDPGGLRTLDPTTIKFGGRMRSNA